jgi:hypothetical protein
MVISFIGDYLQLHKVQDVLLVRECPGFRVNGIISQVIVDTDIAFTHAQDRATRERDPSGA